MKGKSFMPEKLLVTLPYADIYSETFDHLYAHHHI